LIVLDDVAIIADIQPPPPFIGFTINSPSVGEFTRLICVEQNAGLDSEQDQIDRLRGTKIRLSLAAAIFIQANRNLEAVRANADLLDQ
jgi:hypothetical protein